MFVPIILGSDKTTVLVATGQHEYYPIYLSIRNVHNNVHQAHKDTLVLIGFLPIPKGNRYALSFFGAHRSIGAQKETDNDEFRDFKRRLFHGCVKKILQTLKQYMTSWDLVRCADGHFRRVIYGIGPYIADYPEQVLVAGIVNGWCPAYVTLSPLSNYVLQWCRCDAPAANLDNLDAELWTRAKMETLFQTKSSDELWFEHGLISDIHVRLALAFVVKFY